jgi:aryl-alcohol dehydrogenase-like predicted oxidoreductase
MIGLSVKLEALMSNTGLPDNGFEAPGLCLGTMYFGTTVPEQRACELLDHYVDAGGQLLDTANNYAFWVEGGCGDESELVLGRWLTSRGNRDQVLLASKIGARPRPGSRSLEDVQGLSAAAVREPVEGSLSRLGTDHLDRLRAR